MEENKGCLAIIAVWGVLIFLAVLAASVFNLPAAADTLSIRNGGQSLTGILPIAGAAANTRDNFSALLDRQGNPVFFFNVDKWWGFCMGRYNVSAHRWELWTQDGWSSNPASIPQPIGQGFFETSFTRYNEPNYFFQYLTPQSQEIFAVVSGMSKIGKNDFDVHGSPLNFIFNGQSWLGFYSNGFHEGLRAPVLSTWGYSARFSFAANDSGQGLLLASGVPSMGSPVRYYSARYDQDRGAINKGLYWSQWRNNSGSINWGSAGSLTPVFSGFSGAMQNPMRIAYAGKDLAQADNYLITEGGKAFKYNDGQQSWWIWANGIWEPDNGQSEHTSIASALNYGSGFDSSDALLRYGDDLLLIYQTQVRNAQNQIIGSGIGYARASGSDFAWVESNQPVVEAAAFLHPNGSTSHKNFAAAIAPNGELSVFYLSTNQDSQIELREIRYNGAWQTPSAPLFSMPSSGSIALRVLRVLYTSPQDGSVPVVFLKFNSQYLCLSEGAAALWSGEQGLVPSDSAPERTAMDLERFAWQAAFENYNLTPPSAFYASESAWFLAQDADGYLYAPQTGFCSVVIHPPNAVNYDFSKHWGDFWDHTSFPGSVAVDNPRQTVYFVDSLDSGGGGGTPGGRLRWLNRSYRDSFIDTRIGGDSCPSYPFPENGGVIPQLSTPARLAGAMIVDEAQGYLYLASALTGKIIEYDLINRTAQDAPALRGDFISGLAGPVGMVRDEEGRFFIVESNKHRVSIYDPAGSYLASFGELGRGNGQFCYPTQIAYSSLYKLLYVADPMNERLQVFDRSGNFIAQWGTWAEASVNYDFQFLGGISARGGQLWAGTGPTYALGKINRFSIIDRPPREPEIASPVAGESVKGVVPVVFTAQDDWGIVSADLLIEGQPVASAHYEPARNLNASLTWDADNYVDCLTVNMQIMVMDALGQASLSLPRGVVIGNSSCASQSSSSASQAPTASIDLQTRYKRQRFLATVSSASELGENCTLTVLAAASPKLLMHKPLLLAVKKLEAQETEVSFAVRRVKPLCPKTRKAKVHFMADLACSGAGSRHSQIRTLKIAPPANRIKSTSCRPGPKGWLKSLAQALGD